MSTPTEKLLAQRSKTAKTGAILVPILEKLLENECIPEDADDFRFIDMLVRARAIPRKKGVFSPSMLGSCVRQAWFSKRGEEKHLAHSPQTNGYFLKGNFVHFQWQFAMWKAHRAGLLELVDVPIEHELEILDKLVISRDLAKLDRNAWASALNFNGNMTRPGVEVRVIDGDFGGTIDVLTKIKKLHVVDFKGINLIDFQRTVKKGAPIPYRRQIVGYSQIAAKVLGIELGDALLVSECKAGPISGTGSPLALHETRVPIDEFKGDVNRRLKTLTWFDSRDEMPEPECVSTRHNGFQECAFNRHCLEEVRIKQREHDAKNARKAQDLRVARSGA